MCSSDLSRSTIRVSARRVRISTRRSGRTARCFAIANASTNRRSSAVARRCCTASAVSARQVESAVLERRPVLVDLWEQAEKSGEFRWARAQQQLERIDLMRGESGDALTIGDAALGRAGRSRACAYLTGLAVQDLCAAAMIYEGWKTQNAT